MKKLSLLISVCTLLHAVTFAQSPHAAQLYGMTQYGGTDHKGTIFHYTPETQTIQVDYEMKIKVKGKTPKADIVSGNNGKYYGTTTEGGSNNAGVIFEWDSTTSVYTELYNFTGLDGSDARGAMVLYNGKFYGMTNRGGVNNFGVIYEWDFINNIYTKKIDMDGMNGKNPDGYLTLLNNKFYGFTHDGGVNDAGVLFDWDPGTNVYSRRYDFTASTGINPVGKLSAYNNKLYAMTNLGGINNQGVIYEWDYNTNVYTKKFDFDSIRGQHPLGYLTMYNNKFYGMTYEGGLYETSLFDHYGVIFEWNPANNTFIRKKDLGFPNSGNPSGHAPLGSFTTDGLNLWGYLSEGSFGFGSIFSWSPATNTITERYSNSNVASGYPDYIRHENLFHAPGNNSYGAMLLSGNKFICTSSGLGGGLAGCIFEYWPDSNIVSRSVHMLASDGTYPKGSFTRLGNKLFGTTPLGGNNRYGNIFEWDLLTHQYKERFAFDGYIAGGVPASTLTPYNGKLYGLRLYTTAAAPISGTLNSWFFNRHGSPVFSWDPLTDQFHANDEEQFASPQGTPLTVHNGNFFSTGFGGNLGQGSIIHYNAVTDKLKDTAFFDGANGDFFMYQDYYQECGLTYYNGKYYGMTPSKKPVGFPNYTNFKGGIYEWDPVTNIITNRIDFNDTTGNVPTGDLTLVGNVFYGLTSGIAAGSGTLFKWDPATNIFEKKSDLGYNNPPQVQIYSPRGTLTYSGGKLYGLGYGIDLPTCLVNSGGQSPNGAADLPGCIFEFDPALDYVTAARVFAYNGGLSNSGVNPAFTKLLEVIPNELPLLSNAPTTITICTNQTSVATFTISDADLDTMHFQITSSNPALIPLQNISTSFIDSNYTLQYFPQANQSGITTINVVANDGYGGSVNFSFTITINALPTVSSSSSPASANICEGASIILNGSGATTYTWSGGISNNTAFSPPVGTNTYTVTGTDANGCSNTNTQTVTVHSLPIVSSTITPASATICEGDKVILNGTGASTYTWNNGIINNNAFIPPAGTTTYTVTGTDANGCSNTNMQTVVVNLATIPMISINANTTQANIGDAVIYTATINLINPYVINWYRDNVFQTSTSTNSWNTNIVAGNNAVKAIISASTQCLLPDSVLSNVIEIKTIGGISVYPNPTTGEVIVTGLLPNDEIGLYNSIGQRILTTTGINILSNQNKLQLKNYASGAYVLFIKRNEEVFVKKIIKINN